MAKARELKGRIRSVQNTRKITRTMEMVATSKLKRAQERVAAARPYAERLAEVVRRLINPELAERFPLLRRPEEKRAAVVLLTANRGLAGGFNANLIREARTLLGELRGRGVAAELHVAGKKGISFFRFLGEELHSAVNDISDRPAAADAERLVNGLMERFIGGELDAVYVVYAQFKSAMSTPPATLRVLPVETPEAGAAGVREVDYLLEPGADEILGVVLPLYVRTAVYRALVETAAAEQGSRRTAMKNATDNAGDILESLTRTYNRVRQAAITQEIAEIVGGAAALE
jgi:F-type H+-transporting ATPase subunit gamma